MSDAAELDMLRDSARRLAEDVRPARWSSQGRTGASRPEVWSAIVDSGWLYAGLPEALGGFGAGASEVAAILGELGRGLVLEPVAANLISLQALARLPGAGLRERLIADVTLGRAKLALAEAEPGRRFDWRRPGTILTRDGAGLRLGGRKHLVLGAADADHFVVLAQLEGALAAVLAPRGAAGLRIDGYALVDGRGAGDLLFEDVRLPAEALLGAGPAAEAELEYVFDFAAVAVCAEAIGAMDAAFALTLEHTKQRVQFGQPIGRNQALQHRLVDLLRGIKEAEILQAQAIEALPGPARERGLAVSAAKIQTATCARKVGQEAVQMHGAIGSTDEAVISHHFRQLMTLGVLFGDADHHRARFLALDTAA